MAVFGLRHLGLKFLSIALAGLLIAIVGSEINYFTSDESCFLVHDLLRGTVTCLRRSAVRHQCIER